MNYEAQIELITMKTLHSFMNIINNWIWSFNIYQKFIKDDLAVGTVLGVLWRIVNFTSRPSMIDLRIAPLDNRWQSEPLLRATLIKYWWQFLVWKKKCKMDNSRHPCSKILAWLVCTSIFAIIWYLLFSFLSRWKKNELVNELHVFPVMRGRKI